MNQLAFDLGASSGRLMMSSFDGEKIVLTEIHRFENEPVRMNGRLYWDIFRIFSEMKQGLKKIAALGVTIDSLGIDTWGVDYGLLDKEDNLIGTPIAYRDSRTDHVMEEVTKRVSLDEIYGSTGIQFMNFNTIFQLFADQQMRPAIFENAKQLLMLPDLLGFFLTGEKYNEYTILTTAQVLDAKTKQLVAPVLHKLGIPQDLFCSMVMPGMIVGYLDKEICEEVGLDSIPVVAVGSHDTASAVCGTPFSDEKAVFLSCGTWSLLGMEVKEPILSQEAFAYNFTNEGGVEDTIRFLKNINGLWIMQQLRKSFSEQVREVGFSDIIKAAKQAEKKHFVIDPSDSVFMAPLNMMDEILRFCQNAGQGTPNGLGELAMAVYNGLTAEYKANIEKIEVLTQKKISCINMIGGGTQDDFLCSETARVTGKKVVAGPVEASVLGNVIMQLKALGKIHTVGEGRAIVRKSFVQRIYD